MPKNRHAAPVDETGSGADPQAQRNSELDNTSQPLREAASEHALLRLLAGMAADGSGRYVQQYRVTVSLLVETKPEGGDV